jgi:hypothetical protein
MRLFLGILTAFCSAFSALSAQEHFRCGTSYEDQLTLLPRLETNKNMVEAGMVADRNAVQYVPIHIHLVGDNAGEGKLRVSKVLDQICALNAQYAPLEIRFYLSPHPSVGNTLFNPNINNDNVYAIQTNSTLMNQRRHPRAVNVFAVDEPVSGNTPQPGTITQAYYSPARDWVVMRNSEFTSAIRNGVLAHEIGHFFSLPHTFFGYETNPFNSTDATWPKAPVLSPGGQATERQNGTNCTTAGDRFCDTAGLWFFKPQLQ